MTRRRKPVPPVAPTALGTSSPKSILELDRFSQSDIQRWNRISGDLDELNAVLYFGLEPERRRRREELIAALQLEQPVAVDLNRWVRMVGYRYSNSPLSAAGSLRSYGGRFNSGVDLDSDTLEPFPALYLAENFETAYREKFQRALGENTDGLTPEELALGEGGSHSTLVLKGQLTHMFDMTKPDHLQGLAKVLGKIKMPDRAEVLKKRLKIPPKGLRMMTTGRHLFDACTIHNWRVLPVQFGLPAHGHLIGEMIRAAGFEGVLYHSSKSAGRCVALYPDKLAAGSYVELLDAPHDHVQFPRLDANTAHDLCGWDTVGLRRR